MKIMETGVLKILGEIPSYKKDGIYHAAKYEMECYCGNIFFCSKYSIQKNLTKSCGCLFKSIRKNQTPSLKHGIVKKNRRLYGIWQDMKSRCNNPSCVSYHRYGGRGITICKDWLSVQNFYNWSINNGYKDDLTLDRENNDGNYEPLNCRWVDMKIQSNNRSNNVKIEYNGQVKNMSQWAKILGISATVLHRRINIWKLPIEECFQEKVTKPFINKKGYIFNTDIAVCIKNKLKFEGRKQLWLIDRLNKIGIKIPNYSFSLKLNGKDFFTDKEVEGINKILGTNFK